jgi:transposase
MKTVTKRAESECRCPNCGLPFEPFPETEDSEQIEIEVKAHRRVIRRKRYKPTCTCGASPGIVTAPPPPKLISKGIYGISVWVTVLLDKFYSMRPTYRLLADLKTHDLDLAQGTITDGLKTIAPLFVPIYEAIITKNTEENRWHADETRWLVFTTVEGSVTDGICGSSYLPQLWSMSSIQVALQKSQKPILKR